MADESITLDPAITENGHEVDGYSDRVANCDIPTSHAAHFPSLPESSDLVPERTLDSEYVAWVRMMAYAG